MLRSARLRIPAARGARFVSRNAERGKSTLTVLLVWVLIIYQTVPGEIFSQRGSLVADMSANPVTRVIKLALLALSALIVSKRIPLLMRVLKNTNGFFIFFVLLVPMSVLWSIGPGDTLARFISLLSMIGVALAFAVDGWHPQRLQSVLRPVITLLLVGSLIFGLVAPDMAIEQGEGTLKNSWHGLASQKNQFGQLGTFGMIFWLHATLARQVGIWKGLAGVALGFTCVLLSRSSTSLMAAIVVALFMLLLQRAPGSLRRYMPYLIALFAVIVVTYALAVLNLIPGSAILLEPITAITGKDMTFSNRSEIWRIIKEHIQYAPMLGSGYGAYWIGPVPSSPSYTFLAQLYFYPTESHNGYLEIVNDLGYVGMVCLVGFLFVYIRQALQLMKVDRAQTVLLLGLFFQQAIVNLSESCWLAINAGFILCIMTLAVMALARALAERTPQRQLRRSAVAARRQRRGPQRHFGAGSPLTP